MGRNLQSAKTVQKFAESVTLTNIFTGTPLFDVEYLRNGTE